MEKIVKRLFEYGKVERDCCVSDLHELLTIVKKMESKKGVYLGRKDQDTIKRIEDEYRVEKTWESLSVAERQIVALKVRELASDMGLNLNAETAQYQRELCR